MKPLSLGKKLFWTILSLVLLGVLVGVLAIWYVEGPLREQLTGPLEGSLVMSRSTYMQHRWVEDATESEMRDLARLVRARGLDRLYFHVGPLTESGSMPKERYPNSELLLRVFEEEAPTIEMLAWVGQVRTEWGGVLQLGDPDVPVRIGVVVDALLQEGWDGIHLNIEPIANNDAQMLNVLRLVSDITERQNKLLSLATDDIEPFPLATSAFHLVNPDITLWTMGFTKEVAGYVDEMVVMTYDSGLKQDYYYSLYVGLLAGRLLAEDIPAQVRLGLPTYETGNQAFDPTVENIETAVQGLLFGLNPEDPALEEMGVAIYANWETEPDEWALLDTYVPSPSSP